jgi:phosphoserine aminotransferase
VNERVWNFSPGPEALPSPVLEQTFYRGMAAPASRSRMNVTFHLPNADLEGSFVERAAAEGLVELGGHRSVGGIRASIYNAMPEDGMRALRGFTERFRAATP